MKNAIAILIIPIMGGVMYLSGFFDLFFSSSPTTPPRASKKTSARPAKKTKRSSTKKTKSSEKPSAPEKQVVQEVSEEQRMQKAIERIVYEPWGRDPFVNLANLKQDPVPQTPDEEDKPEETAVLQKLNLQFSFFNGQEWVASVNGDLVKVGTVIGEETVTKIDKNKITLSSRYGSRDVFPKRPKIGFSIQSEKE